MKKSKKLIAILCSLALSINMCSVWVFADNKPTVSLDNSNKQIIAMDDITNDVTENWKTLLWAHQLRVILNVINIIRYQR